MMWIVAMIYSLILLSGLFLMAKTDCTNFRTNTEETGYIQSPNYPNEKGRRENCSLNLQPPDAGKDYVLRFSLIHHQLYYMDRGVHCAGQMTVDRKQILCSAHNNFPATSTNCKVYYSSPICEDTVSKLNATPTCKKFRTYNESPFPIEVSYVSDGFQGFSASIAGFRASYEFIECVQETTTIAGESDVPAASSQDKVYIIIASSVTGALLLALGVVAGICIYKRRSAQRPIGEEITAIFNRVVAREF